MKSWIRAFGVACLVEVPLLLASMMLSRKSLDSHSESVLGQILIAYHILVFPFGISMLHTWNGNRLPPVPESQYTTGRLATATRPNGQVPHAKPQQPSGLL